MAKKIFSMNDIALPSNYVAPVYAEGVAPDAITFLAIVNGKQYHSFDDAEVTITEGQGDVEVTILDATADADELAEVKTVSNEVAQQMAAIEGKLLTDTSLVTLLSGIVNNDADTIAKINDLQTEKDQALANLGF